MENLNLLEIVIITKNEAENIKSCIQNAKKISDKILVIDSFSDDDTVVIAQKLGARVLKRKFDDFANQRNFANQNSNAKWILHLDSDEIITDELAKNILEAIKSNNEAVYLLSRKSYAFNQDFNYGVLAKDEVARLFPNGKAKFSGAVHEKLISNLPTKSLNGYLKHCTYKNWDQWLKKFDHYTSLWALSAFENNKKVSLGGAFAHAFGGFFKMAFVKKGLLDGKMGIVLCVLHFFYTLMKYLKLIELRNKQ